jgi:hypothetical protein
MTNTVNNIEDLAYLLRRLYYHASHDVFLYWDGGETYDVDHQVFLNAKIPLLSKAQLIDWFDFGTENDLNNLNDQDFIDAAQYVLNNQAVWYKNITESISEASIHNKCHQCNRTPAFCDCPVHVIE